MASIKTYSYSGKVEFSKVFRLGRLNIRVDFAGGAFAPTGFRSATYTTSNQIVQIAIESSADFKQGLIKLTKDIPIKEEPAYKEDKAPEAFVEERVNVGRSFPEVTNAQGAREVLKAEYGGTQAELQTAAAIRKFAEKVGATFPNWN